MGTLVPAALLGFFVLSGCDSMGGNSGPGTTPPPVQMPILSGIPIPTGFDFVPERSSFSSSGQYRVGLYEFSGSSNPLTVYNFYKQYMPTAGFTMKHTGSDRGVYTMRFESDQEECNVKIQRASLKTVLMLQINPVARGSADRDEAPPPRSQRKAGQEESIR